MIRTKWFIAASMLVAPNYAMALTASDYLAASEACARLQVIAQDLDNLKKREPGYEQDYKLSDFNPAYLALKDAVKAAGFDPDECISLPVHNRVLSRMIGQ